MSLRAVLGPLFAACGLVIIGVFAVWARQPWLAPSIGSAILVPTLTPDQPAAKTWNTAIGQVAGVIGGLVGVYLAAAQSVPSFLTGHHLVDARVLAVAIATLLTAALQLLFKALSPAGGATALVVALGLETPNLAGAGRLLVGILLVTVLGEGARTVLLRLRR